MKKPFKNVVRIFAWLSASPVFAEELVTEVAAVGGGPVGEEH